MNNNIQPNIQPIQGNNLNFNVTSTMNTSTKPQSGNSIDFKF